MVAEASPATVFAHIKIRYFPVPRHKNVINVKWTILPAPKIVSGLAFATLVFGKEFMIGTEQAAISKKAYQVCMRPLFS